EDEAGALILNQDGASGSQAGDGGGGDEAGGDEAGALILNQRVVRCVGSSEKTAELGVKSHPGEGGGGDEAKALILNQYGVLGACSDSPKKAEAGCVVSQPEEGGGGDETGADEAGELVLNQYGVSGKAEDKAGRAYPQSVWDSEAWELSLKKAGGLILNQDGISGAWSEAEKTAEAGTKPERLSSANMGCDVSQPEETGGGDEELRGPNPEKAEVRGLNLKNPEKAEVRGLNLKKAEGTRSEGLSSTNMGSQPEEGEGGDEAGVKSHPGEGGGVEAQAEEDGGKDEVWKLKQKKTEARTRPGVEAQAEEDVDKDEVWKLKPKKTEARCGSSPKKSQARTRSSIMSQSGIQVLSLSGNNVGGGDTDESRRLACREIRLSSTNTASQVLREQGQSAMGLGVRGPSPKKAAGTRLERLSSTTVGFEISSPEAEEGEGGDEAGALILNQDGVSGAWSEAEKTAEAGGDEAGALIINQDGVSGAWSQAEDGGGGDEAGALIINQDGVSGAWSQAEEGEGGDEAGALILNQDGVSGAWSEAEKTAEAGTRPERLSSTKMGFQVLGLKLRRRRRPEREGGDEAGALILNQDGMSGAWSEAEKTAEVGTRPERLSSTKMGFQVLGLKLRRRRRRDGGGGDEAGALILNQDGVSGAWSQAEDGGGGDEAGALILNQDGVSGAWSEAEKTAEAGTRPEHLSSTNMGSQVRGFKLRRRRRRGRGRSTYPQPRWGFRCLV
ncbi:unnamed protein product, partial [Symbiodinium sp. CCMP2592]